MSTTRTITGFPGSGVQTFTDVLGPGGNCYDPDCTVSVAVDTGNTVDETNEGNNVDTYTVIG
jgi:subtilase family serine protease